MTTNATNQAAKTEVKKENLSFEDFLNSVETIKTRSQKKSSYDVIYSILKNISKDEKKKTRKQIQKFLSNESIMYIKFLDLKLDDKKKESFLNQIFDKISISFEKQFNVSFKDLDIKNSLELINYFNVSEFKEIREKL